MKTTITMAVLLGFGSSAALADKAPKAPPKAIPIVPPQDSGGLANRMAGTWKCDGWVSLDVSSGEVGVSMKATVTNKVTTTPLGGYKIESTLKDPIGKVKFKSFAHTTFNPVDKKWERDGAVAFDLLAVDNAANAESILSGIADKNKLVWNGSSFRGGEPKPRMIRVTELFTDPNTVKITGEVKKPVGKGQGTWEHSHNIVCQKSR